MAQSDSKDAVTVDSASTPHIAQAKHANSTSTIAGADPKNEVNVPAQFEHAWWHWHEPGTSKEEKKLIFKLDWFLLSFSCLLFFIKQLDQNNVSNAYVSGMADELGFGPGNELSWMNTYFNIGTIIGGTVANMIITILRPRYWLPGCLLVWSVFVLALYKCNHAYQFYVLRFFIGVFESAAWPGVMYCIGSWYRKSELARRSGLFVMSGVLGQMFSGYLQAALFTGMHGKGEMSAWRWLFIFDFILAIPIVVYGLICFPDTPHQTQAFYLTEWEKERARQRIEEEGRKPTGKMDMTVFKRIFASWQVYAFTAAYSFWTLTCGSYVMQYFQLYLRSTGQYSIPQINNIPTAIGAVNFVFMVSTGFIADKIGSRGPVCAVVGSLMIFNYSVLTAWDVPHKLRMACFILHGCYGCFTPLIAGWTNEACGGDQQKRAFILGFMVSVGQAVVIPFQQLQLPSGKAPEFEETHGWASALAFVVALTVFTGAVLPILQRWREGKAKHVNSDDEAIEDP
ncbi:MFS general substrate transporter [Corynespora cassiicola Philippines]|uniref:MFS general substrate transporter n=1 Tax=Corynespora cassiicola Philippines TaxID=1448308 RepID=A0A2T2NXV8_CORCC|nr:MFS general substrate transporter [Corynespora cassiicola Philippines]